MCKTLQGDYLEVINYCVEISVKKTDKTVDETRLRIARVHISLIIFDTHKVLQNLIP